MAKKSARKSDEAKDAELFAQVKSLHELRQDKKRVAAQESDIQAEICKTMMDRGIEAIQSAAVGLRVKFTQRKPVVIDSDALYADLTPRQRPFAYDRSFNLAVLDPARRVEVTKIIGEALTRAELRDCVVNRLNEERLAQAVSDGRISQEVVARNSEVVPGKPYVTISTAGG